MKKSLNFLYLPVVISQWAPNRIDIYDACNGDDYPNLNDFPNCEDLERAFKYIFLDFNKS